jgi:hypothetical protein
MSDIFTDRETSIMLWTAVFAIRFLFIKEVRDSAFDVIKTSLNKHILLHVIFYMLSPTYYIFVYLHMPFTVLNGGIQITLKTPPYG